MAENICDTGQNPDSNSVSLSLSLRLIHYSWNTIMLFDHLTVLQYEDW